MTRRAFVTRLCAALLLALCSVGIVPGWAVANPLPVVNPPQLNADVSMTPERAVTVTGTLTNAGGSAVGGAQINAILDSSAVGSTTTSGQGAFSLTFQIGGDVAVGDHNLFVVFPGTEALQPVQRQFILRISERSATAMTGAPDSDYVTPGTQVLINGTLTIQGGGPASDAIVDLYGPSGRVADATTKTEPDGTFTTFFVVPEDQAAGELQLTARFDGDGRFAGSSASWTIRVSEAPPSPELSTDPPSPTASDSPATSFAESEGESPTTAPSTPTATPAERPVASVLPVALITGILGAGAVSLAVVALVLRRRHRREHINSTFIVHPEDAATQDAEDHAPRRGLASTYPDDEPPSSPRRG